MKIDATTGDLIVDQQTLGSHLKEKDFLTSAFGAGANKTARSDKNYYGVWKQITPELEVGLTLGFSSNGPLQDVSLRLIKPGTRGLAWSKKVEDEIKRFHDKWLLEQLGDPPYQFIWGRVLSIIEPHWYAATIRIDYTRRG